MTRFVYTTATTLDGFIADPDHSLSWLFAVGDGGDSAGDGGSADPEPDPWAVFMTRVQVAVMGSSTYEWVLRETGAAENPETWPDAVGGHPTVVFSSRQLTVPDGADVTVVDGPVADHLPALRERATGRDVWIVGGGDLVGQFADAGSLDEVQVSVAPVTLGAGAPLLPRRLTSDRLRLAGVERRGQLAHLVYTVDQPAG